MRKKAGLAGGILLTLYICILFPALSFYMPDGYRELGNARFETYRMVSLLFFVPLLACAGYILWTDLRRSHAPEESEGQQSRALPALNKSIFLPADAFAFLYALSLSISYILTDYPEEAFWGTTGWRTGLCTELLFLSYYGFARLFPIRKRITGVVLYLCAAAVLLIAVADRAGLAFLPFMGVDPSFVSTIGNVDWYCSYLAVVFGAAAGALLYYFTTLRKRTDTGGPKAGTGRSAGRIPVFLLSILLLLAVFSVFTQGAQAGVLIPAGAGLSALYLVCVSGSRTVHAETGGYRRVGRRIFGFLLIVFFLVLILLPAVFCDTGETRLLPADGIQRSLALFPLREDFGNGRGRIWRVSWELWRELPWKSRLFGIGPDAFAAYAYGSPRISYLLYSAFGAVRLTNTHSEWFTVLIDEGLFSLIFWAGFLLSSFAALIRRCGRRADALTLSAIFVMVTLSAVQAVSFRTITAEPFLFLLIGAALREPHNESEEAR